MLIGHYSASFAIKSKTRDVPLWVFFIAVQLMDIFWTSLLLLGVEKARVDPSLSSVPLDLYYMPYSHSLVAVLIVCVVGLKRLFARGRWRAAIPLAAATATRVVRTGLPLWNSER